MHRRRLEDVAPFLKRSTAGCTYEICIPRPPRRIYGQRILYDYKRNGSLPRTTGYDKIQKNDLWLLSMFDARHQNGYANVAWVIARWMKRKGAGTQKESQICCGQSILKIARKCRVLIEDVVRSLSAPIYYRDLDTITLRDLINSDGKLIPKDPQQGVPRVGIPRLPRASMHELYDRMGRMEIRQEAIERMEYRQSYHWDRYQGVFEYMDGVYSVPIQGAYNLPSKTDASLFVYHFGPDIAYLLLYVDDIILTASSRALIQRIISSLHGGFAMTDLGALNYFLGISTQRTASGLFLSQSKFAKEILERAHMQHCNPCKTHVDTESKIGPQGDPVTVPTLYRSLVGAL
ncbi:reverse transcriptase domain-containing protein [Tanacetum coccineum]